MKNSLLKAFLKHIEQKDPDMISMYGIWEDLLEFLISKIVSYNIKDFPIIGRMK